MCTFLSCPLPYQLQKGFYAWVSGVIDNAVYPVLFLEYLQVRSAACAALCHAALWHALRAGLGSAALCLPCTPCFALACIVVLCSALFWAATMLLCGNLCRPAIVLLYGTLCRLALPALPCPAPSCTGLPALQEVLPVLESFWPRL